MIPRGSSYHQIFFHHLLPNSASPAVPWEFCPCLSLSPSHHPVSVVTLSRHTCSAPPVGLASLLPGDLCGWQCCPWPQTLETCSLTPQASLVSCRVPYVPSVVLVPIFPAVPSPSDTASLPPGRGTWPFPDQSSHLRSWLLQLQLFMFFYSGFPYFVIYS